MQLGKDLSFPRTVTSKGSKRERKGKHSDPPENGVFQNAPFADAPFANGRFPNGGYSCLWAQDVLLLLQLL